MHSERRPIWREPLFFNRWLLLGAGTALFLPLTVMFGLPPGWALGIEPVSQRTLLFCLVASGATLVMDYHVFRMRDNFGFSGGVTVF